MAQETVLVTRKGQVTIPVEHRKKFGIREGMRVVVMDTGDGILIKPIIPLQDLAGIDAGKMAITEMRKKLDAMRAHDRF
ncbi:MAG: AbrB/MazE/SpoVT family DNA-binding domain-containing protein [Candidatus Bathyarchaeia archaeon]|jgi:AbrB family looped-hinge helix DNA binding protein